MTVSKASVYCVEQILYKLNLMQGWIARLCNTNVYCKMVHQCNLYLSRQVIKNILFSELLRNAALWWSRFQFAED